LETLKELWRVYATLTQDSTRVMSRLKAVYRGQAIPVKGRTLYTRRRRNQWLEQLPPQRPGLRYRVERLFEELDGLQKLRRQARAELLGESRKQPASQILPSIPFLGPIRTALLIARVKPRIAFAANGSSGTTADWGWKPAAVPITGWSRAGCNVARNPRSSAG